MPVVYTTHYWGVERYAYSECRNYTVSTHEPTEEQENYMSSGMNLGIYHPETVKDTIKKHFTAKLKHYPNRVPKDSDFLDVYATITMMRAPETDYRCRYSGPPDEIHALYKINKDGELYCEQGIDFLFGSKTCEQDMLNAEKRPGLWKMDRKIVKKKIHRVKRLREKRKKKKRKKQN